MHSSRDLRSVPAGVKARGVEWRQRGEAGAQAAAGLEHGAQRFGPVRGEEAPRAGLGGARVLEQGLGAGGDADEGQWVGPGGIAGWCGAGVVGALVHDAEERGAFRLGLEHAAGAAIKEQEVVGRAGSGGGARTAMPRPA